MKKLIDKIKSLPLPVNLIGVAIILWAYPFIEAAMIGATGWYDIPIHSLILLGIGQQGHSPGGGRHIHIQAIALFKIIQNSS